MKHTLEELTIFIQNHERYILDDFEKLKKKKQENDYRGQYFAYSAIASDYHSLAIFQYCLHKNPSLFFENMEKFVFYKKCEWDVYPKIKRGFDSSDTSEIMSSLALGQWDKSLELMNYIKNICLKTSHKFIRSFYLCVKGLLYEEEDVSDHIQNTIEYFEKREKAVVGYGYAFKAIYEKDHDLLIRGLTEICKKHGYLTDGMFYAENIAVWGIGVANLARMKGMVFTFDHARIPGDLII